MGKVFTHMTMSLDGFIADPKDQVGELFDWYEAGDVTVPTPNEGISFQVDEASVEMLRELTGTTRALAGRRLFDIANGWGDNHPAGAPVVVVTHRPPEDAAKRWPRTTFVDGVEAAITEARRIAGDQDVNIASPTITQQALDLGLGTRCASASCRCCSARDPLLREAGPGSPAPRRPDRPPGTPRPSPAIPSPTVSLDLHRWIEADRWPSPDRPCHWSSTGASGHRRHSIAAHRPFAASTSDGEAARRRVRADAPT
jgi:dihydrofolate reductase